MTAPADPTPGAGEPGRALPANATYPGLRGRRVVISGGAFGIGSALVVDILLNTAANDERPRITDVIPARSRASAAPWRVTWAGPYPRQQCGAGRRAHPAQGRLVAYADRGRPHPGRPVPACA